MKLLRAIARFLIGITFLFSGLMKLIDPVGTALKTGEYIGIAGAEPWASIYVVFAVLLSSVELLMGFALLLGLRMKFFSHLVLFFISFFTILTFYIALFNPVSDCGCFGEALQLSNWETFLKNLVLLALVIVIFFQKQKFTPVLPERWEWILSIAFFVLFVSFSVYSYRHLPQVDLMEYRAGSDLREMSGLYGSNTSKTPETILIYMKDGVEYEFSIDNLPDSSYIFVDSKTVGVENLMVKAGFAISDSSGYVTDSILNIRGAVFLISVPFVDYLSANRTSIISEFCDSLKVKSLPFFFVTGSGRETVEKWAAENEFLHSIYYGDYKMLFTLNRSFGGLTYIHDGIITSKWSRVDLPFETIDDILNEDPEVVAAEEVIKQNLFIEFLFILLLVVAAVLRFFFRLFYKHNHNIYENREEQES